MSASPATVVGVGASAGGVEALRHFVAAFEADADVAVLVVLHISPDSGSMLAGILDRATALEARTARDGDTIERGVILVAPPNHHLVVEDGHAHLDGGARENGHRPAVDPLLRSIARTYGRRAAGVILSGARDDGTSGLALVKEAGGRAFVQDPAEALYAGMPSSAATHVAVDAVLPVAEIAHHLVHPRTDPDPDPPFLGGEPEPGDGQATRITCPDCGGVLHEHHIAGVTQFRCSVGHFYSPESLEVEHAHEVEAALWEALRLLSDRAALLDGLAARAARGRGSTADRYRRRADEARSHAEALRRMVQADEGEAAA